MDDFHQVLARIGLDAAERYGFALAGGYGNRSCEEVERRTTVEHAASNSTKLTIKNLFGTTTYLVRVSAKNATGVGEATYETFTTPAGSPTAPRNLSGVLTDTGATLSWVVPIFDNGAAITGAQLAFAKLRAPAFKRVSPWRVFVTHVSPVGNTQLNTLNKSGTVLGSAMLLTTSGSETWHEEIVECSSASRVWNDLIWLYWADAAGTGATGIFGLVLDYEERDR